MGAKQKPQSILLSATSQSQKKVPMKLVNDHCNKECINGSVSSVQGNGSVSSVRGGNGSVSSVHGGNGSVSAVHCNGSVSSVRGGNGSVSSVLGNGSVSTKLSVHDQTWPTKNTQHHTPAAMSPSNMTQSMLAHKIGCMKHYSPGEEEQETQIGVSTKLKLFSYPWNITKILTDSDLSHLSRLLVATCFVKKHVLPFLEPAICDQVETKMGLRVNVWDCDTNSMHNLVFKRWVSSSSYVFIDQWTPDFVRRRQLSAGDEIGLYWDCFYSRFNFSVLKRAPKNLKLMMSGDE